jgi:hypothetical protein
MKTRIALTVGLAVGLALLVLVGLSGQAGQAQATCDLYVQAAFGSDSGDCSNVDDMCDTIQYAIDQADPGDVICVAKNAFALPPQVYPETLVIHESITLDGSWDGGCVGTDPRVCSFTPIEPCNPANVLIDAGGAGRVISMSGSIAPTIDCFTIRNGDAAGQGGDPGATVDNDAGGGIYSRDAAPIIVNNVITDNFGCVSCPAAYGRGGGVYLLNAPATAVISNNLIAWNVADDGTWGQGGGIMLRNSDAQVLSNTIEHNRAGYSVGYGGGIMVKDGDPTIADNVIAQNVAGPSTQGLGGGIMVWSDEGATIEGNLIEWNKAIGVGVGHPVLVTHGGGIHFEGSPTAVAVIHDNTIRHNTASAISPTVGHGGGMSLINLVSPSLVTENRLTYNEASFNYEGYGGGIYVLDSEVSITDNRLVHNSGCWAGPHGEGGGLYVDGGTVLIATNVISENYGAQWQGVPSTATGYGGGIVAVGGETIIRDNRIEGNWGTRAQNSGIGGGIFTSGGEPQILQNTISGNYATADTFSFGGGVAISGSVALVQGNEIRSNVAATDTAWTNGGLWGAGGGLYILNADAQIVGNTIRENKGANQDYGYGGGAYVEGSHVWFDRNTITHNDASPGGNSLGGALRLTLGTAFTVSNNIVALNQASTAASGISAIGNCGGRIVHNTIAQNYGGDWSGVHADSNCYLLLDNNIIISHSVGILNNDFPTSTINAYFTLFENNGSNYVGVTSVSEIAGPARLQSDYRLRPGSNAIDQAPPIHWITWDIDRDPRPVGTAADVGADEYALQCFLPLAFRD